MSLRSFTVFQDIPSSDNNPHKSTVILPITSLVSSSNPVISADATTLAGLVSTTEKENVHPLTGERAGFGINTSKKRKTPVLATKVHTVVESKKKGLREHKDVQPEAKKHKSSSSTLTKGKPVGKKEGKSSGSTRKSTKKHQRKASPMPKVDEELDVEKERERMTQAGIDSRCYELTVRPLADVSQAYEQYSSHEENVKFGSAKESSTEPENCDYLSPPLVPTLPSVAIRPSSQSPKQTRAFSTPERKQIYAAFTFSSPSPNSGCSSKITH